MKNSKRSTLKIKRNNIVLIELSSVLLVFYSHHRFILGHFNYSFQNARWHFSFSEISAVHTVFSHVRFIVVWWYCSCKNITNKINQCFRVTFTIYKTRQTFFAIYLNYFSLMGKTNSLLPIHRFTEYTYTKKIHYDNRSSFFRGVLFANTVTVYTRIL